MTSSLLTSRRFAPLFWCQFFSAFNDNFLKNALVFMILFRIGGPHADAMITMAGIVFIAPFFFLSGLGGELADRFDKSLVARRLKLVEIGITLLASAGFALHSLVLLFVALFLFGVMATLFGPIKYGILPDHLATDELPSGNAWVEGATFLAILLGTIVGGMATRGGNVALFSALIILFALLCWGAALLIPETGEAAPDLHVDLNIIRSTASLLKDLWHDARLRWGALVVSWFWLVGAVALSLLPPLVKTVLGGNEDVVTFYLVVFAVGIAVGSRLAAWLLRGRLLLVPTLIGAVLLGLFALDVGWVALGQFPAEPLRSAGAVLTSGIGARFALDLAGLAVAGGLFIVPSFAAVQAWADIDRRARVVAAVSVLSAAFMAAGGVAVAILQMAGLKTGPLFLILGALCLLVAIAIQQTLPTRGFRELILILFQSLFRLEVRGAENLAVGGQHKIVALNHVSFLDAGLALALLEEDPVFAIDSSMAQRWWVKPFLKVTRALSLDPLKPLATRTLINAVKSGETLVIFPEGRRTVTGSLMKVYDGAGLIADKSEARVVPVHIDGLERTFFSKLTRQQIRRRWFPKVTATVLEPVKLTVDPGLKGRARRRAAGTALYDVMSDLVFRTTSTDRTLIDAVIQSARTNGWGRGAVEDPVSGTLSARRLLMGAAILGRKLAPLASEGQAIAVMLPTSNGAAVTLLGLMSAGRVPAMINFTAGLTNILAACKAAEASVLVTSRAFIEKGRLAELVAQLSVALKIVYIEDVQAGIRLMDKARGFAAAGKPMLARRPDDPAVILFTSGTEGAPKGVVLSHRNILANAAQAAARIDFGRTDTVFNVLPVFHSFGFTVGLMLPLVSGVRIYLYPSPLHYRTVPELIYGSNATILFGTDTFLAAYARGANPYDFRSLRYILAGAEAVKDSTRKIYSQKFGVRILEGYGVTETAPALALNTPMFNRFGTVGRLMPGIESRLEPVAGINEGGRLFVRGPNVMLGYLRAEKPGTLEPPPGGWHDTGDIVTLDAQGFVTIVGRAKRFAKVGGEMISLAAVEVLATELWPDVPSAVVALPDARKGEKLVLVTSQADASRLDLLAFAKRRGLAELIVPAEILILDKLPLLGSGKPDYLAIQALVRERVGEPAG